MNLLILSLIASLSSYAGDDGVIWQPISKSGVSSGLTASGRVIPQDGALRVESARVAGRVLETLRREGESVQEGTPLYAISSGECLSLQEEKRVAKERKIAELLEGVQKRETQLGLRLEGDRCLSVAGHRGVVTKRNLDSGASFNPGDVLATTLDVHRLTVELDIPERDQARVQVGQKVTFQFASDPGKTYSTRVSTVVPAIDPATRTVKARLSPTALPKNLGLDALVFGEVVTGAVDSTLAVPSSALAFYHDQQFVVTGPEKPIAIPVQVVNETDSLSSVRSLKAGALHEGQSVAVKGAIFLLKRLVEATP
jgi:Cu(I)/Ag(I) efflux system membrane fusion protein